jgi:hypothetical protein
MSNDLDDAREELDKEFRQLRDNLGHIHAALADVDQAGPLDDVSALLERLEDVVKEVRTGGLVGGGAKGHAKARKQYLEMKGERA